MEKYKSQLKEKIQHAIETGQIAMRPRWHFVLKSVLFSLGGVILLLALLYFSSFVFFALHKSGLWIVPTFGLRAGWVFLRSLPWLLIFLTLIFIVLLEVVVRKYTFGFRKPLLYTAFGILLLALFGGFIISRTPLHEHFSNTFYHNFGPTHLDDVHPCTVGEVTETGFSCTTEDGENLTVNIGPNTRFPLGTDFAQGDEVVVFGPEEDGVIDALGVGKSGEGGFGGAPRQVFRIRFR